MAIPQQTDKEALIVRHLQYHVKRVQFTPVPAEQTEQPEEQTTE